MTDAQESNGMESHERLGDHHAGPHTGDYLLGELTAAQDHEVEAHLLRCPRCRAEAAALSEIAVALASLPEDRLPPG